MLQITYNLLTLQIIHFKSVSTAEITFKKTKLKKVPKLLFDFVTMNSNCILKIQTIFYVQKIEILVYQRIMRG